MDTFISPIGVHVNSLCMFKYLSKGVGRVVCIENLQIHLSVVVVCLPCRIVMLYFKLSVPLCMFVSITQPLHYTRTYIDIRCVMEIS